MGKKNSDGISLSADQLKKITETASRVAIEEYHKEFDRSRQENRDKRLYNTRLFDGKVQGYGKNTAKVPCTTLHSSKMTLTSKLCSTSWGAAMTATPFLYSQYRNESEKFVSSSTM